LILFSAFPFSILDEQEMLEQRNRKNKILNKNNFILLTLETQS
jgi:hypothetical protein